MSLTNKKTSRSNILGKILRINSNRSSSSPDLEVIRKMRDRAQTDNPLFRLSIADYEFMCKDEKALGIMSKLLDTDIKKLKKICKQIHIFLENINSSPETIKNKMKAHKLSIRELPDALLEDIIGIYEKILKYELRDWIPIDKLDWDIIVYNPNAIDLLDANPDKIDWEKLPSNPNQEGVAALIRKYVFDNPKYKKFANDIDWMQLSSNPYAIDLLEASIKAGGRVDWYLLSGNREAIHILSKPQYRKYIDWAVLSSNPSAIDLLADKWEEEKQIKATNITQYHRMRDEGNIVAWNILSGNPNAIDLLRKKIREERKMTPTDYDELEDSEKIAWSNLSANPEAIALLEKNPDKIDWIHLSSNSSPKAVKLLKERVEYENGLTTNAYNLLTNKIRWLFLSANSNAIKILEANQGKIVWGALSNNPKAIRLLEANQDKIVWNTLSGNPEAIKLLEANKEKIDWATLSRNANAMSLLEEHKDKIVWDELLNNPSIFILR